MGIAKDPYRVLGVRREATTGEIHDAYRRLARQLHPDVGGMDAIEMAVINEAWRVLRDPSTRASYDASCVATDASPPVWNEEGRDGSNGDYASPARLRLMIMAVAVVGAVVLAVVFLIGFGRVGVSGSP